MRTRNSVIALVASASLIFAACGGDDDADTTTTAAPTTTQAPTTTAAPTTTQAPATTAAPAGPGDIVEVAVGAGSFTTLAAALGAAGLVDTLQGDGPFTVFAPTDEAFAALPEGLVDALLLPENIEVLTQILLYHVIIGAEVTSDMVSAGDVEMGSGDIATIVIEGDTITIADAEIAAVDVDASNGVIHVISSVMVPAGLDVTALLGD